VPARVGARCHVPINFAAQSASANASNRPLTPAITTALLLFGLLGLLYGRYRNDPVSRLHGIALILCALLGSVLAKTLPAGSCCLGFLCTAGWWIWRRTRLRLAHASLALGIALGAMIGLRGVAAGAYPVSDLLCATAGSLALTHLVFEHARPATPRTLSLLTLLAVVLRLSFT